MFGRATIRLGIGPHSSVQLLFHYKVVFTFSRLTNIQTDITDTKVHRAVTITISVQGYGRVVVRRATKCCSIYI